MDEYAENLPGPALPVWAEEYFKSERSWWRLLRATGAVSEAESAAESRRWLKG